MYGYFFTLSFHHDDNSKKAAWSGQDAREAYNPCVTATEHYEELGGTRSLVVGPTLECSNAA